MHTLHKKRLSRLCAAAIALCLWQPGSLMAAELPAPASNTETIFSINMADPSLTAAAPADSYTLKLFNQDAVLRNPNDREIRYLYIGEGSHIADAALLDLWYTYSPTTRDNLSMMTITVNGVPISSRQLAGQAGQDINWQVPLPAKYLKSGYNAVGIEVVHRTIDGLCRDIDDPANWFIIKPETRVNFRLLHDPYTLASLPSPFFDPYLAARTNTILYIPQSADSQTFAALLNLVSQYGTLGLAGLPQRLEVRFAPDAQPQANEIVVSNGPASLDLTALPGGFERLTISGPDSQSLSSSLNGLSRPQLVKTLSGTKLNLSAALPPEPEDNSFFSKNQNKKGLYTLSDLGCADDLTVAGAFHQKADIEIPRPANYGVGDGSYIELHFRHSPILDAKKSAVTIYVNDIPVRAQALTPENADKGVLKAPIPASELNKPSWRVRFGFYHDLGIIDCSKRYDEVAWSVIEKDSCVYLEPGDAYHDTSWEYFPSDFGVSSKNLLELTMVLPDNPSQEEMTAATRLAYYLGQQNKKKIRWQVQSASTFDPGQAKGAILVIGKNDDEGTWKNLKDALPVVPENGSYRTASWMDAAASSLSGFDICEIGRSKNDRPVYAFLYASPERLNHLIDFMLEKGNSLQGQISLLNEQGEPVVFRHTPEAPQASALAWLSKLINGQNQTGSVYAVIVVVVAALTGVLLYIVRRRRH